MNFFIGFALIAAKTAASPAVQNVVKRAPQVLDPEKVQQWMSFSIWSMVTLNIIALLFFLSAYIIPQLNKILSVFAYLSESIRAKREARAKLKAEAAAAVSDSKAQEQSATAVGSVTGLESLPPPDADEPKVAATETTPSTPAVATQAEPPVTDLPPPEAAQAEVASVVDIDLINQAVIEGTTPAGAPPSTADAINQTVDQSAIDQMLTSVIDGSVDPTGQTASPIPEVPPAEVAPMAAEPAVAEPAPTREAAAAADSSQDASEYFDLPFIDKSLQSVDLSATLAAANASIQTSNLSVDYLNASGVWPPPGLDDDSMSGYFDVNFINEKLGAIDLTPLPSTSLVESIGTTGTVPEPAPSVAPVTAAEAPQTREPFIEKTEIIVKVPADEAPVGAEAADPSTLEALTSFEKTLDEALNTLGDKTEEVPIFDASLIDQALEDAVDSPEANMSLKGPA